MYSQEKMLSIAPVEAEILFEERKKIVANNGKQMFIYIFCSCSYALKNYFLLTEPELLSDLFTSVAPPV